MTLRLILLALLCTVATLASDTVFKGTYLYKNDGVEVPCQVTVTQRKGERARFVVIVNGTECTTNTYVRTNKSGLILAWEEQGRGILRGYFDSGRLACGVMNGKGEPQGLISVKSKKGASINVGLTKGTYFYQGVDADGRDVVARISLEDNSRAVFVGMSTDRNGDMDTDVLVGTLMDGLFDTTLLGTEEGQGSPYFSGSVNPAELKGVWHENKFSDEGYDFVAKRFYPDEKTIRSLNDKSPAVAEIERIKAEALKAEITPGHYNYKGVLKAGDKSQSGLAVSLDLDKEGKLDMVVTGLRADGSLESAIFHGSIRNGQYLVLKEKDGNESAPITLRGIVSKLLIEGVKFERGVKCDGSFTAAISKEGVTALSGAKQELPEAAKIMAEKLDGTYTYTGSYKESGEVEKNAVITSSVKEDGTALFVIAVISKDGSKRSDSYSGAIKDGRFEAKEVNAKKGAEPDVISGTMNLMGIDGLRFQGGKEKKASFTGKAL